MIISENNWRKWLGLPYISVQSEWLEELCEEVPGVARGNPSASWTGRYTEYRWTGEVHDWLFECGGRWSLEHGKLKQDFEAGNQARIWFRHMKNVTLFKLTFGGRQRPKDAPKFKLVSQKVVARSRKLAATWNPSPPPARYFKK